mgnify:CR=1 FL=1
MARTQKTPLSKEIRWERIQGLWRTYDYRISKVAHDIEHIILELKVKHLLIRNEINQIRKLK